MDYLKPMGLNPERKYLSNLKRQNRVVKIFFDAYQKYMYEMRTII